jgi:sugar phosphate isomerase/epimerase
MFRLAYNTNGLAHHRPEDALRLLADLGYEGVALTPDVGGLDLYALDPAVVERVRRLSDELGLALAVETGARYLMDPARKHVPTLMEEHAQDRARRVDFYRRSIDLGAELGAEIVSLWSGIAPGGTAEELLWHRLVDGLLPVLDHALDRGVRVGFEPEPGMFIERPLPVGDHHAVFSVGQDLQRFASVPCDIEFMARFFQGQTEHLQAHFVVISNQYAHKSSPFR